MFTGIIETTGKVEFIRNDQSNIIFGIRSSISNELKIDQSVSHNGVCLTVTSIDNGLHTVTAIQETLKKTSLGELKEGSHVNLERCLPANGRLDGHIVQGHVDQTAACIERKEHDGSWTYTFRYEPSDENIVVGRGSICVNGVSLTVAECSGNTFKVAIIPYTFAHTTFNEILKGSRVNLEFDIIGKYIAAYLSRNQGSSAGLD